MRHLDQDLLEDGTAVTAPGLAFRLDPNTGLFRPGTDRLQVVTNGVAQWEIDSSGHLFPVTDNSVDLGNATHSVKDLYLAGDLTSDGGTSFATKTTSYTPALTAGTNPTLGTGSSQTGAYVRLGDWVTGWATIIFGTSGTNAGNGNYRVSLPTSLAATHAANAPIGIVTSTSAGTTRALAVLRVQTVSGSTCNIFDAATTQYSDTNPGAWTANDRISYHFSYIAA